MLRIGLIVYIHRSPLGGTLLSAHRWYTLPAR
jgi:hypothetical protein